MRTGVLFDADFSFFGRIPGNCVCKSLSISSETLKRFLTPSKLLSEAGGSFLYDRAGVPSLEGCDLLFPDILLLERGVCLLKSFATGVTFFLGLPRLRGPGNGAALELLLDDR